MSLSLAGCLVSVMDRLQLVVSLSFCVVIKSKITGIDSVTTLLPAVSFDSLLCLKCLSRLVLIRTAREPAKATRVST